ncbi:hypothetical protein B0H17DRAFT_1211923 [Mycena rosella]|uniref:Uncharacterized protein n=1 Tax=Mycena rosella TaxID=1033263 RepID=A0AAD7G781_MYCRO|nr:hypothetical protein B0H17DRAFT_1211923 [Mycena rosella]
MEERKPGTGPVRICSIGYYIAPEESGNDFEGPQLILIFGWLGARLLQLMKYSSAYRTLYPAAAQVLILSDVVSLVTGSGQPNDRIADGACQILSLALALESTTPKHTYPRGQPKTCLIFDSAPGGGHHADLQRAMVASLTGLARLWGLAAASAAYAALKVGSIVSGRPMIHDFVRDGLNNPHIFPWIGGRERFLGSRHVMHAKAYPDRYWGAVRSVWGDMVRSKL